MTGQNGYSLNSANKLLVKLYIYTLFFPLGMNVHFKGSIKHTFFLYAMSTIFYLCIFTIVFYLSWGVSYRQYYYLPHSLFLLITLICKIYIIIKTKSVAIKLLEQCRAANNEYVQSNKLLLVPLFSLISFITQLLLVPMLFMISSSVIYK